MTTRNFALVFGVVFLLVGIAGFIPQLVQPLHPEHPALSLDANSGQLLGLFPVNVLHELASLSMDGYSMATGGILVQVPEEDLEDARQLLDAPEETS